ncbi:hypothetical protein FRC05_005248 [Tulasnella sp. 425]|nr:hypothetical protein FRC05_005248 [Tulasnella sp. 425]
MHPILKIPDILCLVFRYDPNPRDLLSASLVGRLWGEWASDILWRTFPVPLSVLLQTLAPLKLTHGVRMHGIPKTFDIGVINEATWQQFVTLSKRVREIRIDFDVTEASLERFSLAKETYQGAPFTKLHTIDAEKRSRQFYSLDLVAVPSLCKVFLLSNMFQDLNTAFLNVSLPAVAPNITVLGVSAVVQDALNLSLYTALRTLELGGCVLEFNVWESLSSCHHLTYVVLSCFNDYDQTPRWEPTKSAKLVHFSALRDLRLEDTHGRIMWKVLTSDMPMLESIVWNEGSKPGNPTVLSQTVEHLRRHSPLFDPNTLYERH